ncbi:hypothetical protein PENSPDRAFT_755411 [Peniophora sp. CONT]|nr:hypothetical protein PENSPDRAFT_755411 [Peniophora sp. CONT]
MSSSGGTSQPQSAQAVLDAALDGFREQWVKDIQRKARRKNSVDGRTTNLWTLKVLNDDVLRYIFHFVAALEPAAGYRPISPGLAPEKVKLVPKLVPKKAKEDGTIIYTSKRYNYPVGWIRLTHVCHHWRKVLLAMPELWNRAAFTFPDSRAFSTLLSRIGNGPVDIRIFRADSELGNYKNGQELSVRERTALEYLTRARSLTLYSKVDAELLSLFPSESWSSLRHLGLTLSYRDNELPLFQGHVAEPLTPENSIAQPFERPPLPIQAPFLESFSLELSRPKVIREPRPARLGFFYPELQFILPSLRSLQVHINDGRPDSPLRDFSWFIELMRTSPLIETLSLSLHLRYTPDWNHILKMPPPPLVHLKHLTIEDTTWAAAAPLVHCICPIPPPSLILSWGTYKGNAHPFGRLAFEFARGFGGFLCHPTHQAFTISLAQDNSSPAYARFASTPALDDPASFIHPHLGGQNMTEPVNGTVFNLERVDMSRSEHEYHDYLEVLGEQLPDTTHVVQLFLNLAAHNISAECMDVLRQHLLLPMTAARTLHIVQPFTTNAIEPAAVNLLRPSETSILPELHTLIVAMHIKWVGNPDTSGKTRDRIARAEDM